MKMHDAVQEVVNWLSADAAAALPPPMLMPISRRRGRRWDRPIMDIAMNSSGSPVD